MQNNDFSKHVSIINVMNKLKLDVVYSSGDIIYVKCPFCFSKTADMKLNISNNSYVCKNCEAKGYSIGLYAKTKFMSNKEAFKKLISEEPEVSFNIIPIVLNTRKNDTDLTLIYSEFLKLLKLETYHLKKLLNIGLTENDIKKIGFKTIPKSSYDKNNICKKLINDGYDLRGIPGFYQDTNFKWTFKTHNGFFVPVINNNTIIGLRINLDNKYNNNTTNIWFSSNNCFNGTKMKNDIMILLPENSNFEIFNSKVKKDVIIATEILLAYKLHSIYKDEIIIGIPNIISKEEVIKLSKMININKIYMVMDYHTIMNSSNSAYDNLVNYYGSDNITIDVSNADYNIPVRIQQRFKYRISNIKVA